MSRIHSRGNLRHAAITNGLRPGFTVRVQPLFLFAHFQYHAHARRASRKKLLSLIALLASRPRAQSFKARPDRCRSRQCITPTRAELQGLRLSDRSDELNHAHARRASRVETLTLMKGKKSRPRAQGFNDCPSGGTFQRAITPTQAGIHGSQKSLHV